MNKLDHEARSQILHLLCEGNSIRAAAQIRGETQKAWRLFDGTKTEWVPKSQVENNGDGTFTMPEWLARDKGFI
jgi:hypothetical protein